MLQSPFKCFSGLLEINNIALRAPRPRLVSGCSYSRKRRPAIPGQVQCYGFAVGTRYGSKHAHGGEIPGAIARIGAVESRGGKGR